LDLAGSGADGFDFVGRGAVRGCVGRIKHFLPPGDFRRERRVDFAMTALVRVIPEGIVTVPAVEPAGMIQNRVETNAVNWNSTGNCRANFAANVAKPALAVAIFSSGFRNERRAMITLENFPEHFAKRTIQRMLPGERLEFADAAKAFEVIEPLIVRIK